MALVAAINFRGVGESVKANVVLTLVELSGLLMIIFIGFWAMSQGRADFSEVMIFQSSEEKSAFMALTAATSLAFFAMVGFEDSVNMAEEVKDPVRIFPKMMLTGLGITGLIYVLVSICAVALVPVGDLVDSTKGSALTQVVRAGAPGLPFDKIFPFIGMFAVANSALINMLMASRLLYGLAHQGVLPHVLGTVHPIRRTPWVAILFTTAIAFGLIYFVVRNSQAQAIALLGGTTALLLLCVFTVVNVALIVLRRRPPVGHAHFRTPGFLPWVGAFTCAYLAGPWARSAAQMPQYRIAAWLLAIGIVLWAVTWAWNRAVRHRPTTLAAPRGAGRAARRRAQQLTPLDPRRRLRHNGRDEDHRGRPWARRPSCSSFSPGGTARPSARSSSPGATASGWARTGRGTSSTRTPTARGAG